MGGVPNVQRLHSIRIGETVPEQLAADHALEKQGVDRLNGYVPECREKGDAGSALLLEEILESEEEHLDWIEAQQDQIEQMGLENYLAQQVREND